MAPDPHADRRDEDDLPEQHEPDIDEASQDSFPASDPPSYGAPETGAERD
jgi:hypothetical protein